MKRALELAASASSTLAHYVAGVLLLWIMVLTVADVALRWLGGQSIAGSVELTEITMVAMVYLALAHAERHDEHVAVDVVYARLPRPVRHALLVTSRLVALAAVLFLAWRLIDFSGVLRRGGYTTGVLRIDLTPVAWVAAAGALLLAATVLVRLLAAVRQPDELDEHQPGGPGVGG